MAHLEKKMCKQFHTRAKEKRKKSHPRKFFLHSIISFNVSSKFYSSMCISINKKIILSDNNLHTISFNPFMWFGNPINISLKWFLSGIGSFYYFSLAGFSLYHVFSSPIILFNSWNFFFILSFFPLWFFCGILSETIFNHFSTCTTFPRFG